MIQEILSSTYFFLGIIAAFAGAILWAARLESRMAMIMKDQEANRGGDELLHQKVEFIDSHGTREVALLNDRVNAIIIRLNSWDADLRKIGVIEEREIELLRRVDEISKRLRPNGG